MALDEKVKKSVMEAVSQNNQSESVARKIINLLEELSNGTVNLNNQDSIKDYLKVILEAINIEH
ncbi:CxC ATPase DNA modification system associated small protein [Myxosarcina sp. GI1]|uniref:CxC ATPase DNA modification system associated small protein n=1 Tax=Myxosarcina sp. GI1 TaxID=1541065 RepID=UPI0005634175|nr:CxC ATPase DNA modification system associated small protein [Myxosarcina sp. GI1]